MPPKGVHPGGYSEVNAAKMANVALPPKVRCQLCKKWKAPAQYSNKQLADLKYKILIYGKESGANSGIKCRTCTGQQVIEMECIMCDTIKELDGFYKAQRRDPDHAKCIECIEKVLALEPGYEEVEVQDDNESEDSNPFFDNESLDSYSEIGSGQLNSLSLAQYDSETTGSKDSRLNSNRPGPHDDYDSSSVAESSLSAWNDFASVGGASSEIADGHVWTAQNNGYQKNGTTFTAYDAHGMPHSRMRAPSSVATEISRDTPVARSVFEKSSKSKFARPTKIAPKGKPDTLSMSVEKSGYTVNYSDDEDDEDDYLVA